MSEDPYAPRTVRPRTRVYKRLPIIAVDCEDYLGEDGIIDSFDLYSKIPTMPPTLFVTLGSADWLARISEHFSKKYPTTWQYKVSSNERGIVRPDGVKFASLVTCATHFFGFKNGNYHKLIDPIVMYGRKLDEIWPGDEPRIQRLMQWAQQIRDFCDENGMEVRPTIGGIGAQFLTDRRFYPHARRKVPRAVNDRAREELPGNHYNLAVQPGPEREFTAWYVDQHRAHHYHARTAKLPDSNSLYAYGRFIDLELDNTWEEVPPDFYGLLCLDLCAPPIPVPFDWISHRTKNWKDGQNFVFTNELQHVLDMGYTINAIRAAWGSFNRDTGLPRYATWADQQLERYGAEPWLKPLLLATYGTLAIKPGYGETIFRLAKGEPVQVLTGHYELPGILTKRSKKLDPGIANVIHRGMIEAGCRSESVGLAQQLIADGFKVLSIYADAVIVEQPDEPFTDGKVRFFPALLPEPWRIKETLNHLQFVNKQAFISGEMTKLPGVGREINAYGRNATPRTSPLKPLYEAPSGRRIGVKEAEKRQLPRKRI